jgi:hypothetical protein
MQGPVLCRRGWRAGVRKAWIWDLQMGITWETLKMNPTGLPGGGAEARVSTSPPGNSYVQ